MTLHDLGQMIQKKREAEAISIEEVAGRIKVSVRTLKAIEDGSTEALPHAVYTKGFIRSYAIDVGMPLDTLNDMLEEIFPAEVFEEARPEAGPLARSYPTPGVGKKIAVLLLMLTLLAGLVAGIWYIAATYGDAITQTIKQPFSAVSPPAESTHFPAAVASLEALSQNGSMQSAPDAQPAAPVDIPPAVPAQTSAPAAQTPPAPAGVATFTAGEAASSTLPVVSPLTAGKHVVQITSKEECYLRVQRDSGQAIHYTMKPNEQYAVRFDARLNLVVGNAGGIAIAYDGKDIGRVGEKQKRRELNFPL